VLSCSERLALPARGRLREGQGRAGRGAPPSPQRAAGNARGRGAQVGSRAERMGLAGAGSVFLYSATRLEDILREVVAMRPRAVVVDSIQTVYLDDVAGSAGSVSQARARPARARPARRAPRASPPGRHGRALGRRGPGAAHLPRPSPCFSFFWGGGGKAMAW